jgi:tetratricopeptide (TPR) repeat protein
LELSTAPVEDEATVNIMVKAANVLYHEEKWQEAIDLYSRCILRDNKCTRAYINRAQALIYLNQYPQAIKDCDIVLQLDEKNVKALDWQIDIHAIFTLLCTIWKIYRQFNRI